MCRFSGVGSSALRAHLSHPPQSVSASASADSSTGRYKGVVSGDAVSKHQAHYSVGSGSFRRGECQLWRGERGGARKGGEGGEREGGGGKKKREAEFSGEGGGGGGGGGEG